MQSLGPRILDIILYNHAVAASSWHPGTLPHSFGVIFALRVLNSTKRNWVWIVSFWEFHLENSQALIKSVNCKKPIKHCTTVLILIMKNLNNCNIVTIFLFFSVCINILRLKNLKIYIISLYVKYFTRNYKCVIVSFSTRNNYVYESNKLHNVTFAWFLERQTQNVNFHTQLAKKHHKLSGLTLHCCNKLK